MTTLRVTITDSVLAEKLAKFLKTIAYVKDVTIEKPLEENDWVKPGRKATVKEMNKMLDELAEDKTEYTTAQVRKELKKWKKGK